MFTVGEVENGRWLPRLSDAIYEVIDCLGYFRCKGCIGSYSFIVAASGVKALKSLDVPPPVVLPTEIMEVVNSVPISWILIPLDN